MSTQQSLIPSVQAQDIISDKLAAKACRNSDTGRCPPSRSGWLWQFTCCWCGSAHGSFDTGALQDEESPKTMTRWGGGGTMTSDAMLCVARPRSENEIWAPKKKDLGPRIDDASVSWFVCRARFGAAELLQASIAVLSAELFHVSQIRLASGSFLICTDSFYRLVFNGPIGPAPCSRCCRTLSASAVTCRKGTK